MRACGKYVMLTTSDGQEIASLSQEACKEWRERLDRIVRAKVLAMVQWRRSDEGDNYRDFSRVETWEVPLVEVVYYES